MTNDTKERIFIALIGVCGLGIVVASILVIARQRTLSRHDAVTNEYQGVSATQIEDRFRDGDSTMTVYRLTSGERILVISKYAHGVAAVWLAPFLEPIKRVEVEAAK